MTVYEIVKEFKTEIRKIYREKLIDIILFGSYARNNASPDSDIDVLVVISDEICAGREIDRMMDIIYDVILKYNVLLSVVPISEEEYQNENSAFLLNIRREGKRVA